MYKIPVWRTVSGTYAYTIQHLGVLLKLVAPIMVLIAIVNYFTATSGIYTAENMAAPDINTFKSILPHTIIGFLLYGAMATQLMNFAVSGGVSASSSYASKAFWVMLIKSMGLMILYILLLFLFFIPAALAAFVIVMLFAFMGIAQSLTMLAAGLVFTVLAIPLAIRGLIALYMQWTAIIVGDRGGVKWAWRLPKGNLSRIGMTWLVLMLPSVIISQIGFSILAGTGNMILFAIITLLGMVFSLPMIIGAAFTYMALRDYAATDDMRASIADGPAPAA